MKKPKKGGYLYCLLVITLTLTPFIIPNLWMTYLQRAPETVTTVEQKAIFYDYEEAIRYGDLLYVFQFDDGTYKEVFNGNVPKKDGFKEFSKILKTQFYKKEVTLVLEYCDYSFGEDKCVLKKIIAGDNEHIFTEERDIHPFCITDLKYYELSE